MTRRPAAPDLAEPLDTEAPRRVSRADEEHVEVGHVGVGWKQGVAEGGIGAATGLGVEDSLLEVGGRLLSSRGGRWAAGTCRTGRRSPSTRRRCQAAAERVAGEHDARLEGHGGRVVIAKLDPVGAGGNFRPYSPTSKSCSVPVSQHNRGPPCRLRDRTGGGGWAATVGREPSGLHRPAGQPRRLPGIWR